MDSDNCGYCEFCAIGNYKSCVGNYIRPHVERINRITELMRIIDAYAFDYKTQGKLAYSRRVIEGQLNKEIR